MLELQQPSQLNKLLFPDLPGTWRDRWSAFSTVLPIILISMAVFYEGMFLTAWIEGRNLADQITPLLALLIFVPLLLFFATELEVRVKMWSKRRLLFGKKRASIIPGKPQVLNWKYISGWQLEPSGAENTLRKLSVQYRVIPRGTLTRNWSMILNSTQVEQFRNAVRDLQDSGRCKAELIELRESAPTRPRKRIPALAMWSYAIAYALFVHGLPLLLIGILGGSDRDERSHFISESFKAFIVAHFHSVAQLRGFYITSGALLCLMGAWSYRNGWRRMKAATQEVTS